MGRHILFWHHVHLGRHGGLLHRISDQNSSRICTPASDTRMKLPWNGVFSTSDLQAHRSAYCMIDQALPRSARLTNWMAASLHGMHAAP